MTRTSKKRIPIFTVVLCVAIAAAAVAVLVHAKDSETNKTEVISVSRLERIVKVSDLSTLTAVYNGIAEVENPEKENEINYYVSYEAKVNAGIDFEKIDISVDDEEKIVKLDIPEVYITEINVDIASLDYIFVNDSANTVSASQEAFAACEADVKRESEQQGEIFALAKQNAENILTALVRPIIEQLDAQYTLVIE